MGDDQQKETSKVVMIERVRVAKFDHALEDQPTVPVETVVQETRTEVSQFDAMMMGWKPKDGTELVQMDPEVEATGTVQLGVGDGGGRLGD